MKIRGLGYIGLRAEDLSPWETFAEDLLGFMPSPRGEAAQHDDALYYRLDERSWRIAIHRAEEPGLAYLGWELSDRDALNAAADQLASHGVALDAPGDASARGV
ncbi:MAG: biphenyl-2,3-diol 1,2-dioxygenase, partial [Myxococcota bacterium]